MDNGPIRAGRVILLAVALAGCGSPLPSAQPSGSAPQATGAPSPAAKVSPSIGPSTTVSPGSTVPEAAWSSLSWAAPIDFPPSALVLAAVRFAGAIVVAGEDIAGGQHVAAMWRSVDGTTFSETTDGPIHSQVHSLTVVGSTLVAIGIQPADGCPSPCPIDVPAVWTTSDGRIWQAQDASSFAGGKIVAVAGDGHRLVAIGERGWNHPAIWETTDGRTWQAITLSGPTFARANLFSMAWFHDTIVVGGQTGGSPPTAGIDTPSLSTPTAWLSTDGTSWNRLALTPDPVPGGSIRILLAGATGLLAFGSNATGMAWRSTDATRWTSILKAEMALPSNSLASDGRLLVAVGHGLGVGDRFWTSQSGTSWRELTAEGDTDSMPGSITGPAEMPQADFVVPTAGGPVVIGLNDTATGALPVWLPVPG